MSVPVPRPQTARPQLPQPPNAYTCAACQGTGTVTSNRPQGWRYCDNCDGDGWLYLL